MAYQVPTNEPECIRAGETLTFRKSLADFSAGDGWAIQYSFRGNGLSLVDFTSAASGTEHLVTVTATATAGWLPGTYTGVAIVFSGSEKHQVWTGFLKVLPDLSQAAEGADTRSNARKILEAIEATILGVASDAIMEYEIEGVQMQDRPMTDLLALRDKYAGIVKREEIAIQIAAGKGSGRRILTRFRVP